jgi:hypothetical protein
MDIVGKMLPPELLMPLAILGDVSMGVCSLFFGRIP